MSETRVLCQLNKLLPIDLSFVKIFNIHRTSFKLNKVMIRQWFVVLHDGVLKRNVMTVWPQYVYLFPIIGLARKFVHSLKGTSLSSPEPLKIWARLSELLENDGKNKQRNALMNKGQKVEGGVFVLHFSANVYLI